MNAYILSFSRRFLIFLLVGFKLGSILLQIRFSSSLFFFYIFLFFCCSHSSSSPILFGSVQISTKFDSDCLFKVLFFLKVYLSANFYSLYTVLDGVIQENVPLKCNFSSVADP